jgi:hypothetical protein
MLDGIPLVSTSKSADSQNYINHFCVLKGGNFFVHAIGQNIVLITENHEKSN